MKLLAMHMTSELVLLKGLTQALSKKRTRKSREINYQCFPMAPKVSGRFLWVRNLIDQIT